MSYEHRLIYLITRNDIRDVHNMSRYMSTYAKHIIYASYPDIHKYILAHMSTYARICRDPKL